MAATAHLLTGQVLPQLLQRLLLALQPELRLRGLAPVALHGGRLGAPAQPSGAHHVPQEGQPGARGGGCGRGTPEIERERGANGVWGNGQGERRDSWLD